MRRPEGRMSVATNPVTRNPKVIIMHARKFNMFTAIAAAALGALAQNGPSFHAAYGGSAPRRALSPLTPSTPRRLQDIKAGSKRGVARARRLAAKRRNVLRNRRAHR